MHVWYLHLFSDPWRTDRPRSSGKNEILSWDFFFKFLIFLIKLIHISSCNTWLSIIFKFLSDPDLSLQFCISNILRNIPRTMSFILTKNMGFVLCSAPRNSVIRKYLSIPQVLKLPTFLLLFKKNWIKLLLSEVCTIYSASTEIISKHINL